VIAETMSFHSTTLLDFNFHARDCVEAFCDLLDYGKLLFPPDPAILGSGWEAAIAAVGNMETCEALIRLDRKTYADPSVGPKINDVLAKWPRSNGPNSKAKGCEVAHHADDMHLRLAIRNGDVHSLHAPGFRFGRMQMIVDSSYTFGGSEGRAISINDAGEVFGWALRTP